MLNRHDPILELPKLVLASGSPRRAEILNSVGWRFETVVPNVDESEIAGEPPETYVSRLAREKAESVAIERPGRLVLGADTTVVVGGNIVGKPVDDKNAARMIRLLSGNWHEVLTGVALAGSGTTEVELQRTRVKFALLSESEVEYLVRYGDPLDKAGAYAVQAQAALFIEAIEGDYWNVVGLPISLVYKMICRYGSADLLAATKK